MLRRLLRCHVRSCYRTVVRTVNCFFSQGNVGLHGTLEVIVTSKILTICAWYAVHTLGVGNAVSDRTPDTPAHQNYQHPSAEKA